MSLAAPPAAGGDGDARFSSIAAVAQNFCAGGNGESTVHTTHMVSPTRPLGTAGRMRRRGEGRFDERKRENGHKMGREWPPHPARPTEAQRGPPPASRRSSDHCAMVFSYCTAAGVDGTRAEERRALDPGDEAVGASHPQAGAVVFHAAASPHSAVTKLVRRGGNKNANYPCSFLM